MGTELYPFVGGWPQIVARREFGGPYFMARATSRKRTQTVPMSERFSFHPVVKKSIGVKEVQDSRQGRGECTESPFVCGVFDADRIAFKFL